MTRNQPSLYLTSSEVARRLGVGPDRVRQLAREGRIEAAAVTASGQRLYNEAEVQRLEHSRRAAGVQKLGSR